MYLQNQIMDSKDEPKIFYDASDRWYGVKRLDLSDPKQKKQAQEVVGRYEKAVSQHYTFACEELRTFQLNCPCFYPRNGMPFVSGSTYPSDGHMPVFQEALKEMRALVA